MIAKGKRKDNGKWITGYPLTYGFEDKWSFVPESINELEIVPVEKKTICRYIKNQIISFSIRPLLQSSEQ